jgi:uncharacterized phage-associated protein
MPYPASAVANEFLKIAHNANVPITPMKLQKLVYFAHGWYLGLTNCPLINEPVQAWKFGPVIPSIYHALKKYGNNPIRGLISDDDFYGETGFNSYVYSIDDGPEPSSNEVVKKLIARVWEVYGGFSPVQLSNLTHETGTPWYETPDRDKKRGVAINEGLIRDYFRAEAERNRHA